MVEKGHLESDRLRLHGNFHMCCMFGLPAKAPLVDVMYVRAGDYTPYLEGHDMLRASPSFSRLHSHDCLCFHSGPRTVHEEGMTYLSKTVRHTPQVRDPQVPCVP